MTTIECRTQAALDKALKAAKPGDIIACVGKGRFVVTGSATVRAFDSATVRAFDSATVRASGSATVRAFDSATVTAFDSATVRAFDSATVTAFDSATVRAFGSATVRASGSATVRAFDSATVRAFDSATVRASKYVPVQRHGRGVKVAGGVLIEVPDPASLGPADWCEFHGVTVTDGMALLYKAVDDDYSTDYARRAGLAYRPGTEIVEAPDWRKTKACGNGLHASPWPWMALVYNPGATRYVEVRARTDELVVIDDKVKAPRLYGPFTEVDLDGKPVAVAKAPAKRTRKAAA